MESPIRQRLFDNYAKTHESIIQPDWNRTSKYLQRYFRKNYYPALKERIKAEHPKILEIGCNNGAGAAALRELFPAMDYTGIDLSPSDIEMANSMLQDPVIRFVCADGAAWCLEHPKTYDLIVLRAVLEHIPKNKVEDFIVSISTALSPSGGGGGVILVDVPNMDWIFASHERYMDLTHECGYTWESLGQLFRNYFSEVEVSMTQNVYEYHRFTAVHTGMRMICRFILATLLHCAEPYISKERLWNRDIMVIAANRLTE